MGDADYRLDSEIARGGFGAVYRATHLPTGAAVAVKVLHDHLSDDPAIVERFRREAEVLRGLTSPHAVTTYELGALADGRLFIAMELLHGESLAERLERRGALPWQEALAIVRGVCAALAEAHAAGIVHRDLKPANIFLGEGDGAVKVLDFGIAKRGAGRIDADDEPTALTQVGQVLGTLEYMAPEQLIGGEVDARADVFALGLVLYEMLTGDAPFGDPGNDAIAHVSRILAGSVMPPSRYLGASPVTAAFDRAIAGCLAARAKDRFASVAEVIDALDVGFSADDEPTQIAAVAPMPRPPVVAPRPSLQTLPLPALERPARGSIAPLPVFVMHSYKHRAPSAAEVAAPVVNRPSRRSWLALAALALANIAIGLAVANAL